MLQLMHCDRIREILSDIVPTRDGPLCSELCRKSTFDYERSAAESTAANYGVAYRCTPRGVLQNLPSLSTLSAPSG